MWYAAALIILIIATAILAACRHVMRFGDAVPSDLDCHP